ncbi:MAG: preprotein translocase subunit SecY [Bacteroidia bacterium]|jgi:preprotein translocase subunit SecY
MKKFISTLKNIYSIPDLRTRIGNTLLFILIYRIGSYVVLPGIDPGKLDALQAQSADGILGLISMFTGGAFSNASIFALGIMPYISASIVLQLAGLAVPALQKMQREGESGRKKITQYTRYLTIIICGFQGPGYIANLMSTLPADAFLIDPSFFWFSSWLILITGTVFVMWLGEKITDKGIGNGISLLIMIGIIAQLPFATMAEFGTRMTGGNGGLVIFILEIAALMIVITACIMLVQGTRRIPVQVARAAISGRTALPQGGARQYIPLKVNAAGVMPIIFAQAIMFVPVTLGSYASDGASAFVAAFSDFGGFWYNLVFAILIIVFTYFYTAITINPNQMADDMKRNGGFIPGIKPGKRTGEYLDNIMSRITLPGSMFLAFVAIMPAFAMLFGVNMQFSQFYGGTSLLIMVGVVLDTLQQVESHLLMRHYDGLMKTGKIKGRSSMSMAG